MIGYKDRTFCIADCVNEVCAINKVHTQKAKDLPVMYCDLSEKCPDCEKPEIVGKDLFIHKALYKALKHMNGFNDCTRAFYSLGIEVAMRMDEVRQTPITEEMYRNFQQLHENLGLQLPKLHQPI